MIPLHSSTIIVVIIFVYICATKASHPENVKDCCTTNATKGMEDENKLRDYPVKAPRVRGLRGDFRVESKGRLKLRCKVSGNPFPLIEWFRNGKKLRNNRRISIRNRRKLSLLEIAKVNPAMDTGYYECRASNAASAEPAVGRARVIVTRPSKRPKSGQPRLPFTSTPAPSSTTRLTPTTTSRHPYIRTTRGSLFTSTSTPSPSLASSSASSPRKKGGDRSLAGSHEWVRSCPIDDFCLNGGLCSFYESIGEYVCQCAEGYKGMRCEMKDLIAVYTSR